MVTGKCVTTALCKLPSIGIKQCDRFGNILKRFQVSFTEENEYTKCCNMLSLTFKFCLSNKDNSSSASSSSAMLSSSQVVPVASSQMQQQNSQSFVHYISQTQPTQQQQQQQQPQVYYPVISSQPKAKVAFMSPNQEFIYPSITSSNPTHVYAHLPDPIPDINMGNIDELKKLTDSSLRAAIRNQIKLNPEFVEFVSRLDRIIDDI